MKKKLLAIFMTAVMLFATLAACTGKTGEKEEPKDEAGDDTLVIDEQYTVVRNELSDEYTKDAAIKFRNYLSEKLGKQVGIITDYIKKGEEPPEKEIVIGKTNREMQFDTSTLQRGDYVVVLEGKRVFIQAYDSTILYMAIEQIVDKWDEITEGKFTVDAQTVAQLGSNLDLEAQKIRVMSQNIRYADDGNGNDVSDRAPRFRQLVEKYDPDLIGTQESTKKWNSIYKDYFDDKYYMVGCSRNGVSATTGEWGTVMVKKARFDILDSGNYWLTDTPNTPSKVAGSNFNRICTWVLLKDKYTGNTLVMANAHLDYADDSVKSQQVKYLLEGLSEYMDKYPVFLTGDFNATPGSAPYNMTIKEFSDSHDSANENRSDVNYTCGYDYDYNGGGTNGKIIDYCFHNDKALALWYRILSDQFKGYVSDHHGVLTEFVIQ